MERGEGEPKKMCVSKCTAGGHAVVVARKKLGRRSFTLISNNIVIVI